MKVYYNESDKKKCAMLLQLMRDGHISKGDIDDRSITDVQASDVARYDRAHFFAGIGLWDHALNLARWPKNMRVWTGSCPCQPFSTAGRQEGKDDDRHLWPGWERLITECKPPVIFGEQVANAVSKGWLDDVYQGLEAEDYAVGSAVLPACSVGAPHKRDRLWFVGYSEYDGSLTTAKRGSCEASIQYNTQGQDCASKLEGASESQQLPVSALANNKRERSQGQRELQRSVYSEESGERQTKNFSMIAQCGTGKMECGSTAQTGSKGSLNPHPCWLMGIPKEWVLSMRQAMRSYRSG